MHYFTKHSSILQTSYLKARTYYLRLCVTNEVIINEIEHVFIHFVTDAILSSDKLPIHTKSLNWYFYYYYYLLLKIDYFLI